MKHARISDTTGQTPLVRLPLHLTGKALWLKLEKFNPGQSMKDRMARSMLDAAEADGRLQPGATVVESSSGNTATALAILAAERGYRFIAVVDHHAARDKIRTLQAYGVEVVRVGADGDEDQVATRAREAHAERLAGSIPGAVFLRQAHNLANRAGYVSTMARELFDDLGADLQLLVGAVGTGGSLSGTARGLKALAPGVRVIGVEPAGSIIFGGAPGPYYQSGTGTPGGVDIGANVDFSVIDEGRTVSDGAAFTTARFLARHNGLLVGGAAGGVIYTALALLAETTARCAVAIVGDGGEKYLDTVFDDAWFATRGLQDETVERALEQLVARYHPR